jgi:2-polyprenyl-3-methyl-5-hydroxy-6-metoxy-1,4-benzoquinol methylase
MVKFASVKKNTVIEIEKARQAFAAKNKLFELKRFYEASLPEIKNLNTAGFWDERIDEVVDHIPYDGMTDERIRIAYGFMPKNTRKILDIGAGYGYIEKLLSRNADIEIFGNDISENAIQNLKNRFKGSFKLESLYKMKYEHASFDVVFMLEVLEHVVPSKLFKLLADVKKILGKGGYLIASVPTNEGLEDMNSNPNGHVRMYTEDLIAAELKIAGFEVVDIKTLYAFKDLYFLKKIISKFLKNRWKPNDIIIKARSI